MITPEALATMATVVVIWSGAHFFGIGEIADVVLLVVGWVAVGGVALEAASKLYEFAIKSCQARTEQDITAAGIALAEAITLIGVNTALALLLRKKPDDTFKTSYRNFKMPRYSAKIGRAMNAPRNSSSKWRYMPTIRITDRESAGRGSTNHWGDITIGRQYDRTQKTSKEATQDMLVAIYHERVHQFIAPKFYLLRELRTFMRWSAYNKSYLLRYLEEALAETIGLLRAKGMSVNHLIEGFRLPLTTNYEITYTLLRHETAGILLGPVTVGGLMYNVYYGMMQ
ncbi:hypothetical protein ACQV2B_18805 [Pantoea allii]|uniref:hypothetical protein n=1 Tax=Pantoea allii TaxID=574096 RepID=UPI0039772C87